MENNSGMLNNKKSGEKSKTLYTFLVVTQGMYSTCFCTATKKQIPDIDSSISHLLVQKYVSPPYKSGVYGKSCSGGLFSAISLEVPISIVIEIGGVYTDVTVSQVSLLQKYQRNMTLRNEAEEGDEEGKKADAPEPARRGGRKRRHEEVCFYPFISISTR